MAAPKPQAPALFGPLHQVRALALGQPGLFGRPNKSLLVFKQQHSDIDVHFQERFLGVDKAHASAEKCFYYINENRLVVNYDFHLRMVFSELKLNKDNLVSLFVNEPIDRSTVLPNILLILETFRIHPDELRILKNSNFSLKVSKSYLNEYEEIKELISAYCKDSSKDKNSPYILRSPSPVKRHFTRMRNTLSQSVELQDLPCLEDSAYNLARLLPPEKRFSKAISDKSIKRRTKRTFPGSKGPTLKKPLGIFEQMRKRALINEHSDESSQHDLSMANRSMLRRVLRGMTMSSQKTRDFLLKPSGKNSLKSLTVKQTYSEKKFNDFLARHRRLNRESEISFDQSTRFTKKAKKSFCFKTIHSKLTNGFKKTLKKTFSLRSLNTQALKTEPKESSFAPIETMNLNDLTNSFVQRESDRKKSFITIPHGKAAKPLMSITQESLSDSEKSVQSLQTRPYQRRNNRQNYRSEDDFGADVGVDSDTVFMKNLEMLKELDEEVYLNYMQQHLDYYEFLDGKESMALIGKDFSKKEFNINKINLRYRENEQYYIPRYKQQKRGALRKKYERVAENNSKKTQKIPVPRKSQLSAKLSETSGKAEHLVSAKKIPKKEKIEIKKSRSPEIPEMLNVQPDKKNLKKSIKVSSPKKSQKSSKEEEKQPNNKPSYPLIMPIDSKPIMNSNVNTLSWMLKDSDTKLGSLGRESSEQELRISGFQKLNQPKFVESQKILITEGLSNSQRIDPKLKISAHVELALKEIKQEEDARSCGSSKQKRKRKKRKKRNKQKEDKKRESKDTQEAKEDNLNLLEKSQQTGFQNEKFASELFVPKQETSGLMATNIPQANLLSSTENLAEKIHPLGVSEVKLDQLDLLSEKSQEEVEVPIVPQKSPPQKEKKKRKRKKKKKKKKKKKNTNYEKMEEPVQEKEEPPIRRLSKEFLDEKQDKKILEFVSEFDQLTERSRSEKMKVLRRGIEELSKGTRTISPEPDNVYNRLNTDEKLLSLLALSKENDDKYEKNKELFNQLAENFEELDKEFKSEQKLQKKAYLNLMNMRGILDSSRGKGNFRIVGDLETAKQGRVLRDEVFKEPGLDCLKLSDLMDEIENREKFQQVEHFYLEKSRRSHKIVIIDTDLH